MSEAPVTPTTQALDTLEFAHGAVLDAIGLEDGLDGAAGHAVLKMIRAALVANGRTPPAYPAEDEVVTRTPFLTAEAPVSLGCRAVLQQWLAWCDMEPPFNDPAKSGADWDAYIQRKMSMRNEVERATRAALSTPAPQPETHELFRKAIEYASETIHSEFCTRKHHVVCIELDRLSALAESAAGAAPRREDDKDLPSAQDVLGILKPYADSESGKD